MSETPDDRGVGVPVLEGGGGRSKFVLFSTPTQRGSFTGVKLPANEAEDSLATSAEVKKTWIYTSTTPYAFMA
jgi:hypothetical protein